MDNGRNPAYGDKSEHLMTSGRIEALPANQQKALAALLSTTTIEKAAVLGGLTSRTIKRYLATPEFAAIYRERRALIVAETIAGLEKLGAKAVSALDRAVEDVDVNVRIRAARTALEYLLKGGEHERRIRELDEIEAEIEELRKMVEATKGRAGYYGS